MSKADRVLYAVVGVGDVAVEKLRSAGKLTDRKARRKTVNDLVKRGRNLSSRVIDSSPTRQAVAQTKTARAQVRAAATSVTKAVRVNARAGKSAAQKTVQAS